MADKHTHTGATSATKGGAVGIKETLTSLLIAFMLAFLFRGFVIEGFQIPTGSMAPTLLGKHIRISSPYSGYDWAVGPWTYADPRTLSRPVRNQTGLEVQDPMTGLTLTEANRRLAAGDRVFVLKYLPLLEQPKRWDVVVFKFPGSHENYIKRLVGLPGEQIAFVDGDVFHRPFVEGKTARAGWDAWTQDDWRVARKGERVQREMFQDVFDSRYAPVEEMMYRPPFDAATAGWSGISEGGVYHFDGLGATALVWNGRHPLTDINAYNQTYKGFSLFAEPGTYPPVNRFRPPFPVSDLAVSLDIKAGSAPVKLSPVIGTRGMEMRAVIDTATGTASVEMRDQPDPSADPSANTDTPWTTLDQGRFKGTGRATHRVEFWHVDQALWLFIDAKLVAGGPEKGAYTMTPAQRASAATGRSWDDLEHDVQSGDGVDSLGVFADQTIYKQPTLRWEFSAGDFTLTNVRVQRDIAYQINQTRPTRGGHPNNFPTMTREEYFMCGDNSANSADSRLWFNDEIAPWVRQEIDDHPGMVHRDLIVGKAFVVYFPAPLDDGPILTPDVGRVRWIW